MKTYGKKGFLLKAVKAIKGLNKKGYIISKGYVPFEIEESFQRK
jgi:hypothetical protein